MSGLTQLLLPDVKQILAEGDYHGLGQAMEALHPVDVGEILGELEEPERSEVFLSIDLSKRQRIFEHLEEEVQMALLDRLRPADVGEMLDEMAADDRADLMKALSERTRSRVLALLSQEEARDVRQLIAHAEGTAGAVMTTEFASVPADVAASKALEILRQIEEHRETINYIYVVNEVGHLAGVLTLRGLVFADPDATVSSLMMRDVVSMRVDDDQEEVAQTIAKYDFLALPIVDELGELVGIVTYDDAMDVLEEEQTEDVQRLGAVEPLETPYLQAGFWQVVRKRILWLTVLFAAGCGTAWMLGMWKEVFAQRAFLMFFVPLIIASGGNSGSQSATLIIRALSVGELRHMRWHHLALRELGAGLSLGLSLGTMGLVVGLLFGDFFDGTAGEALVVALTVVGVVVSGSLLGTLVPLLAKALGLDPALSSTPFVASIIDILGVVIYVSVARVLLGI